MSADGAIAALPWDLGTSRWQLSDQTTPLRNGDPGIAQSQALYKNPLYNAATDFTPVVLITEQPTFLIVRRDLPAENLREFSAYAKANHAKMQFASAGAGSPIHLACVLVNSAIGINVTHVPYRGGAPAMQDLVAGRIDYLTATTFAPLACALVKTMLILLKDPSIVLLRSLAGLPMMDQAAYNPA
jgi:tripartite-type tricarboxylate transporter receptor subunit TctC